MYREKMYRESFSQPLISAQEFDVIREIFYAGGAIKARHAYEAVVDTEIARLVTAEGSQR